MQGVSTKVTASTLSFAVLAIIYYVLFEASWGPGFVEFPQNVKDAIQLLVIFAAGYLVKEGAINLEDVPE
jgi:hypothetical protein